MLLRPAQTTINFVGSRSNENTRVFAFAILGCCKNSKKLFMEADRVMGIKQLYKQGRHN